MKKLSLAVITCLITIAGVAQKELKKGNLYFKTKQYVEAAEAYKAAGPKIKDLTVKGQSYFNVGECYRLMTSYKAALEWYDMSARAKYDKANPLVQYNWGLCLMAMENYTDAVVHFNKFIEMGGDRNVGNAAVARCENAAKLKDTKVKYTVDNVVEINSEEFDYAMNYASKKGKDGDTYIFSSSRKASNGSKVDPKTGEDFMDLYTVNRDKKGKFGVPQAYNTTLNTQHNEGPFSFSKDYSEFYYTYCECVEGERRPCNVRYVKFQADKFSDPVMINLVDRSVNDTSSFGHPCLTKDGKYLYFASDMPGGKGGKDIWYASFDKKTDTWTSLKNLSSVNTDGDELFPWIGEDGTLYFSSTGHPGMGGFDLFKATKNGDNSYDAAVALPYPINSSSDDFAMTVDRSSDLFAGFFSSNRPGGKGKDDIYYFKEIPLKFTMQGYVYDEKTGAPVENAEVVVKSTDGSEIKVNTDASGAFALNDEQVLQNNTYNVNIGKMDYIGIVGDRFSTRNLKESTNFAKEYFIQPIEKGVEYHMPLVQYPFNKTELLITETVNSADSLNYLFDLLSTNPKWQVELQAHTDARGSDADNQKLSDGRAKTCFDYLVGKGIEAGRVIPVGKGEKLPLTLKSDYIIPGSGTVLKAGDVLTEAYINGLPSKDDQEVAHQLNRRTVFMILATDWDPSKPAPALDQEVPVKPAPKGKKK
jgi:peptidoglycan-associated lipoprotein